MNQDLADIRSLDHLLHSLYTILKNEKDPETRYAERTIGRMGNNIGIALSDDQADLCELYKILKADYKSLFPPKSGLTEFYIRREDAFLQCRLNAEYKTSWLRLKQFWTGTDKIKPQTATGESRKDGKDDEKSPEPGQKGNAEE